MCVLSVLYLSMLRDLPETNFYMLVAAGDSSSAPIHR